MVVYPSLGGALDGAVAMQQNIERHNRTGGRAARACASGCRSGDATEEDGDYFGEPVVEAARLCAKAEGGQIVTTEMVRHAGPADRPRLHSLGDIDAEGSARAGGGVRGAVGSRRPTVAELPLPGRLAAGRRTGVVGRALEREQLLDRRRRRGGGRGSRVVLLSGEPGIGKTTLAGDLAQRAHGDGCDRAVRPLRRGPRRALPAVRRGARRLRGPRARGRARGHRRAAPERAVPARAAGPRPTSRRSPSRPSTDADAERYLLFGAVAGLLADMASTAPVVLVLDDLHWADKPTVLLLRHLVATLDRAPVLVVGTYRDSDLTAGHPLTEVLAALRREPGVERMAIGGLDDDGVVALAGGARRPRDGARRHRARPRRAPRDRRQPVLHRPRSLRHLAETGAIRHEDGRWVAAVELSSIGLPESVREVVGQRVRRLGEDAHSPDGGVGHRTRLRPRPAGPASPSATRTTCSTPSRRRRQPRWSPRWRGGRGRFTFTHALFQHTLYDELSASRRARIHRRIGELLEAECGDDPGDRIGELAHHWVAATRRPRPARQPDYARRAGERALAALAPDEAIRWFRQAIELLDADPTPDARQRLDVLIGLGDAQRQAGDPGYRETLLEAAAEAIRARRHRSSRRRRARQPARAGEQRRDGRRGTDRRTSNRRWTPSATLTAEPARCCWRRSRPSSRSARTSSGVRAMAADAEAMARRLGDDAALLRVLNMTFVPLLGARPPRPERRGVRRRRSPWPTASAIRWPSSGPPQDRVYAMASKRRSRRDRRRAGALEALAHEIGQPFLNWS